jgi:hypothetical protein
VTAYLLMAKRLDATQAPCVNNAVHSGSLTAGSTRMQILVTAPKDGEADQLVLSHGTRPKGQGLSDSSLLGTVSVSDSFDA